jgi:hypothetical protein
MPRGSPPGVRRGGRQKGTPNKATAEIKEAARVYTKDALQTLVNVMKNSDSDAAKVSACKELLDRAWGKATQPIAGDPDQPLTYQIVSGVPREVIAQQGEDERETALH